MDLGSNQPDKFLNRPDVPRKPRFHRGRHAQRLMDPAQVVKHEVGRPHVLAVLTHYLRA
jgi:hypothetical protein